ncbi:right-handed parallel beta-helix repeat-containing protein [Streptomyces sp. B6B3]|uniref:right-handed parallel beta-helix repeat-containing protein n=1 Tax=Streptomyces sp. B6B3 TaxID=3153570 RepID=UPI00325E7253
MTHPRRNRRARPTGVAALALAVGLTGTLAAAGAAATDDTGAGPTRVVEVGTAEELTDALADAQPGDTIRLAPGAYDGTFFATAQGTAEQPITLTGPRDAVLSNADGGCDPTDEPGDSVNYCGYGLHLNHAAHWELSGFAVTDSAKGIVLDDTNHVLIDGVEISETGAEAVHFRASSSDNVIRNSTIHDTGLEQPQYGEGIYFGSAVSNWPQYGEDGGEGPDRSDRNQALNNTVGPDVTAEAVDVKEGTEGGVVRGNTFDGHGITGENYADSWLDMKGNGYLVEGNIGTFDGDGELLDGHQVHSVVDGYGCGNSFRGNDSDLGGAEGYAIHLPDHADCDADPNVVYDDNTVTDAGSGLTNIEVTPAGTDGS